MSKRFGSIYTNLVVVVVAAYRHIINITYCATGLFSSTPGLISFDRFWYGLCW